MNLFFHHVGTLGASQDFPKTIYNQIAIDDIERVLPIDFVNKHEIISELRKRFKDGRLNCWGVPSGAQFVIKNLRVGDTVLLIEKASRDGKIPALCIVEAFWSIEMPELSKFLWQNDKYHYIFFFNTEHIDLPWDCFLQDLDYKPNFRPSGQFLNVANNRWPKTKFRSAEEYVNSLTKEAEKPYITYVQDERVYTAEEVDEGPTYIEGATEHILINAFERNQKARDECIKQWGTACSVCGVDFKTVYGELGRDYIHVHHLIPLSTIGKEYIINPTKDLRPVCPNCHAMLHRRNPPLTIEELQQILKMNSEVDK